jgi:hypothetical protein
MRALLAATADENQPPLLDYLCQTFIIAVNAKVVPLYTELVELGCLRAVPLQTLYFMISSGEPRCSAAKSSLASCSRDSRLMPASR